MQEFELNFDLDGDGINDAYAYDSDLDGFPDAFIADTNGDGYTDTEIYTIDYNGDGLPDSVTVFSDTDANGVSDMVFIASDTNYDGYFDSVTIASDTTGNGLFDTIVEMNDYNQNESIDQITEYRAADGSENYDIVSKKFSTNDDGIFDEEKLFIDPDHDGRENIIINSSFDAEENTQTVVFRDNETGTEELLTFTDLSEEPIDVLNDIVSIGGADGYQEALGLEASEMHGFSDVSQNEFGNNAFTYIEGYDNMSEAYIADKSASDTFDPNVSEEESVIGSPEEAMDVWEYQGETNRCAVYSQKFVIEEILEDTEIDIEELAGLAEENGWFSEEGGTPLINMGKILDHYGIENEMTFNNSIDDISNCLENGGKVIVAIDADEVWYGRENDDLFSPADGANHAVEVIGIDNTDPDNPMVILNDSGYPDGCGELVPLDVFVDAWEDSNCMAVTVA